MDTDGPPSPDDAPAAPGPEGPLALVGGFAFAAAAAALTVAILPAARLAPLSGRSAVALVPFLAAKALPMAAGAVYLARAARDGLRPLLRGGAEEPEAPISPYLAAAGVLTAFATVAGAGLFATTHHRGLAGATFAVVTLLAATGLGLLARRVIPAVAARPPLRRAVRTLALALFVGAIGLTLRLLAGVPVATVRGALQDALVLFVAAGLTASDPCRARRLAYVGPPLLVLVVAGALVPPALDLLDLAAAAPLFAR